MNGARSAAFFDSRPSKRSGGSTTWSSTLTRIRSSTCMVSSKSCGCDGLLDSSVPAMDGTSIVRRPPFGTNPLVGERGSDTQRRILGAALEVFAEVGFNETRVELITERAGCSRPAFYQYFSSKDDVFWKLAGAARPGDGRARRPARHDHPRRRRGGGTWPAWIDEFTALHAAYAPVFAAFQAASRDHEPLARGSSTISDRLGTALLHGLRASTATDEPTPPSPPAWSPC